MESEGEEKKEEEVPEESTKVAKVSKKEVKSLRKKEEIAKRKEQIIKKKEQIRKKKEHKKRIKLLSLPEPSQQAIRAIGGGLLAVFIIIVLTYVLWGIIQEDSILNTGAMIDTLSMGNAFNSFLGVWALSFTPLTSIGILLTNWGDTWYFTIIPIAIAGITVGATTKRLSTAILGGICFIFWGIFLPLIFIYIFSIFGICDPVILDSVLIGILEEPMSKWMYDWLMPLFNNNIFISWSIAGSLEVGLLVTIIALPFGALVQLIKK